MHKSEGNSDGNFSQVLPAAGFAAGQPGGGRRLEGLAKLDVSPEALRALPADFVKRHGVLPFEIRNGTLHIVTSIPGNQKVIEDIRLLSGMEVAEIEAP